MWLRKIVTKSLILLCFCFLNTKAQETLTEKQQFGSNPGNLKLFFYNSNSSSKKPLVVVLHGCSQTAKQIDAITHWSTLGKQNGFAVIFPQQKLINNPNLCFNWFQEDNLNNYDEVKSIQQMIEFAIDSFNVDTSQIFIYGVSAGAIIAQSLCANTPWLFKSAAICAGIPYKALVGTNAFKLISKPVIKTSEEWGNLVKQQSPNYKGAYPNMIFMHGTEDNVVNFDYSTENLKQWCYIHTIATQPSYVDYKDALVNVEKKYFGTDVNYGKVILYIVNETGHKIPVDSTYSENNIFAKKINFNSTLEIAKDFKLIKHDK